MVGCFFGLLLMCWNYEIKFEYTNCFIFVDEWIRVESRVFTIGHESPTPVDGIKAICGRMPTMNAVFAVMTFIV